MGKGQHNVQDIGRWAKSTLGCFINNTKYYCFQTYVRLHPNHLSVFTSHRLLHSSTLHLPGQLQDRRQVKHSQQTEQTLQVHASVL